MVKTLKIKKAREVAHVHSASRRVLIVSYAMRGHAAVCIGIAKEMAQRGHRVWFAIPADGIGWITGPGVGCISWDPELKTGEALTSLQLFARSAASRARYWAQGHYIVVKSMSATYEPIFISARELMKQVSPDLVFTTQTATPVMDAARALGVPLAVTAWPGVLRRSSRLLSFPESLTWRQRRVQDYWILRLWLAAQCHERERRRHSECLPQSLLLERHTVLATTAQCIEGKVSFPPNIHLHGPVRRRPDVLGPETAR